MKNLHYLSLHEVADLIRTQEVSPVQVVEECLARIEKLNRQTNAFITVLANEAQEQARQAEAEILAGKYRGPLHGIPVAFKDLYDTAGIKTTAGFEHFKNRIPQKDAAVVTKLREAGAIIVGKTNMHELAMGTTSVVSAFGAVHNPWSLDYIAGGSSGGSAVAIALGMCFATVDTDAIGSTRLPAACCGVVGYKCTWGLIDSTGVLAGEQADETILKLASVGIITRDPMDTALVLDVLADPDKKTDASKKFIDKFNKKAEQRIGIVTNFEASNDVRDAFDTAVKELRDLNFTISEIEAPFDPNLDMSAMDEGRKTASKNIFKDVDVLILPTTAGSVPKIDEVGDNAQALSPQNTFFTNYYDLPTITVPCGTDKNGLPVGLQVVAKAGEDCSALQVASAYQHATDWHTQHPSDA